MEKKKTDQEEYEEIIKREIGRPRIEYTEEVGNKIATLISEGWTIKRITSLDGMPGKTLFWEWLQKNKEFTDKYVKAKAEQQQYLFDELFEIADKTDQDYEIGEDGKIKASMDHIQRAKLRVDTRKWALSKLNPKKYGERMAMAGDEETPLVVKNITDNEKEALNRYMQTLIKQKKTEDL